MAAVNRVERDLDDHEMERELRRTEHVQHAIEALRELKKTGITPAQRIELLKALTAIPVAS